MSWLSKVTGNDRARNNLNKSLSMVKTAASTAAAKDPLSPESLHKRYGDALDSTGKGGWTEAGGGWKEPDGGWEDAFNKTAGATLHNALPGLRQGLQLTREDAIRRGISTGDLGTSFEGDFVGAWENNLANSLAGQAAGQYNASQNRSLSSYDSSQNRSLTSYEANQNRYLDLLTGGMDRNTAEENAKKKRKSGLWGGVGALAGGLIGGPTGASIGYSLGSGIGGY